MKIENDNESELVCQSSNLSSPVKLNEDFRKSEWDQNLFPIHQDLINILRTLNPLNTNELAKLKSILSQIITKQTGLNVALEKQKLKKDFLEYLQIIIKLNQTFALIDVDYALVKTDKKAHLREIIQELEKHGGLNYVPRDTTAHGRLIEHAIDAKTLLKHILKSELSITPISLTEAQFFVSSSINLSDETQSEDIIIQLRRDYILLTLSANGKAELYFHAYVWISYCQMLSDQKVLILSSKELLRLKGLSVKQKQVFDQIRKYPFGEREYNKLILQFSSLQSNRLNQIISLIQASLFVAEITQNKISLYLIEKLLIQLMGYPDINCRDQAIILLNSLYDRNDWQLKVAFRPVIRCIGQHFKVNLTVQIANFDQKSTQIFMGLSAPSPHNTCHDCTLTWHKIDQRNIVSTNSQETEILINFGKFWKCGFYDWRLFEMTADGKLQTVVLTKPPVMHSFPLKKLSFEYEDDDQFDMDKLIAQGRYIVQAQGIKDQTFHEVQVDSVGSKYDFESQTYKVRGTFESVEKSIPDFAESGVTVLYLMGVLERDNCPIKGTAQQFYAQPNMMKKENASPLAVTSRDSPCEMLGGFNGFKNLMKAAKKENIKIIIDCLARISSSRHHRKFRHLLLQFLDQDGRRHLCYGTDGHAINYEDTAMLNYRKIEAWDYLIEEVLKFATQTGIDGIHLDNGQAWPQIFEPDIEELTRKDLDGEPAYNAQEIMDGEIVIKNENYGYWQSNAMEWYPNPFFIKLCKEIWRKFPQFMILGECWGGFKFEHRQIILARSGVIPRLFKLPQTLCSIFGKKLHRDGRITKLEKKEPVQSIFSWYNESKFQVPEGSILIQSSTSHSWPYPAYLYGKGTWAAVDILFFMPDIPITFNGEVKGEIFRIGSQGTVYQAIQQEIQGGNEIIRQNSQVRIALNKSDTDLDEKSNDIVSQTNIPVIRSQHKLSVLNIEQIKSQEEMCLRETKFRQEVGPNFGFDLKKINSHYEHRRYLRQQKMVLRYGLLCPLSATNQNQIQTEILTFARYSLMETAIFAINLSESESNFCIDLDQLQQLFCQTYNDNTVVMVESLLPAKNQLENIQEHFFLKEFMSKKHFQILLPYSSSIQIVTVCPDNKEIFQLALTNSLERTKDKLQNGQDIDSEQISLLLQDCLLKRSTDGAYFSALVTSLKECFLDKINVSFIDFVLRNCKITSNPFAFANLLALCHSVSKRHEKVAEDCKTLIQTNTLGPIVFCTPEVGRWSTVGGLGVMVDELSVGLAKLGQEIILISPYYDKNRKGQQSYLADDPSGIFYVDNIQVQLDTKYTIGVHEGIVSGVKVVFLHHSELFPLPYAETTAQQKIRSISVFSKACLEYCCKRQIIPSICVTNDWFSGFVAAYARIGAFGLTFQGTTFMHICHNLMEDYEGRVFPEPKDGWLQNVHQLPKDWLIDPSWGKNMINPSRTAILMSDQWSTVSKSYRDDLLNSSPLSPVLKLKDRPFAFPNGIPIADRIQKMDAIAPNHLAAKKIIQIKYFNFSELDDSIALFVFVGRITSQKGVHMILDIAEQMIQKYNSKVQFLVGGPANMRDPYAANCAHRMWNLKQRYPYCFWAAPEDFFTDGSLVNRGADFGLMPSLFEPGGIVQHEFFVGCTPVIAFKTGGLKDSVFEFQWETEQGCGFTFESYKKEDFLHACQRAIGTFQNKNKYSKLRQNAFEATMPGETVCKAWLGEFYRLRNKIYFDYDHMLSQSKLIIPWKNQLQLNVFDQMFGSELNQLYNLDDIDFGANDLKEISDKQSMQKKQKQVKSEFDKIQTERVSKTFMLHNRGPRHKKVQLCGSFDNWEKYHQMQFDHITNQWFISLQLPKGEHLYKYVVNDQIWVVNEEERQAKDQLGNLNNFIII